MSNFDENVVNKLKRLEREIERLKTGSEKANPDGWIPVSSTWTYASATTITVPSGAAAIYKVGQGFRLTANGVVKQGYIVGVADTLLTIVGDALTNHTFSAISYTNTPGTAIGFPKEFTYSPTASPSSGSWTTATASGKFTISGGYAEVDARVDITTNGTAGGRIMLSLPTANAENVTDAFSVVIRNNTSGAIVFQGAGFIYSGNIWATKYDGTYAGANSYKVLASGRYRIL